MNRSVNRAALRAATLALLLAAGCSRPPPRPNVVLVVLDTMRRDFTGQARNPYGLPSATPAIDELARDAASFTNAWANAPWTPPSHASLFTGLLPSAHKCHALHPRFDPPQPTLAEVLGRAGYETVSFYSNPLLTDRASNVMRGFATQQFARILGVNVMEAGAQGGPETLRNIGAWLAGRRDRRPFFMFVNFLETHLPFDPPPAYRAEHLPDLPSNDVVAVRWAHEFNAGLHPPDLVNWDRVRRLYAGDCAASDALLGSLLDLLKDHGAYDTTALIITADHGENLGDHDLMEHQFCVYETLLAVPLVVRAPGHPPGVRGDPVMLTDVFATVLDLAGLGIPPPRYSRSLLAPPLDEPRPLLAEYAGGPPKLVAHLRNMNPRMDVSRLEPGYITVRLGSTRLTIGSNGAQELHDLSSDPGQEHNLAGERPEAVETLRRLLESVEMNWRKVAGDVPPLDDDLSEQLRSLGYLR